MVRCSNCGAEVVGSNFCFNCGEKVDMGSDSSKNICPKCGTKNSKTTSFCVECGYHFEGRSAKSRSRTEWEKKRDEILEKYDALAEEFGIKEEDYFLTSVRRFNKLEKSTGKLSKNNMGAIAVLESSFYGVPISSISSRFMGNETVIDGFFIIKEDKFVLMEIDNRDWEKVNAGINNFYFDKIVSMRVTKSVGADGRYEDITKRTWVNSPHALRQALKTDINKLKSLRFKDMIANNDSADMFDRLLIKTVDNTSYEIRLPSFEFGNNLVELFEMLRNRPQTVVVENQDSKSSKADLLREYNQLFKEGVISEEEFNNLKKDVLKGD